MVEREVQGREHVVVVLDFGAFGNGEAEMLENLVDVSAHNAQRVARTFHLVGRHTHVEACFISMLIFKFLQLFLHLLLNHGLQFVELHAHLLAEFGSHGLEVGKQGGDNAFLAQISDTETFQGFFAFSLEFTHLIEYFFYFFFH